MKHVNVSRWEVLKNTKTMLVYGMILLCAIVACLYGIIHKTSVFWEVVLVIVAFFLLLSFRRTVSYLGDIVKLRTRVLEGTVRKLVFNVDYKAKHAPLDYDLYELVLASGEALRFPCAHKLFDSDLAKKARFVFLESTLDIVKAEIID